MPSITTIPEEKIEPLAAELNRIVVLKRAKPLTDMELSIIKGLATGRNYESVAQSIPCHCVHARNLMSRLFQLFSAHYKETIKSTNFVLFCEKVLDAATNRTLAKRSRQKVDPTKLSDTKIPLYIAKISDILLDERGSHLLDAEAIAIKGVFSGMSYKDMEQVSDGLHFTPDYYKKLATNVFKVLSLRFNARFKKNSFAFMCDRYLID